MSILGTPNKVLDVQVPKLPFWGQKAKAFICARLQDVVHRP